MKSLYKSLILIALVIGAIASYSYGSSTGLWFFIILGALFEGAFWLGIFRNRNTDK